MLEIPYYGTHNKIDTNRKVIAFAKVGTNLIKLCFGAKELNNFFDPSTPFMRKVDDKEKKRENNVV